ncbi:MAG TPA: hypothetical protein VF647_02135 [Longimicrobium sp.]|jgi:hypothetical protein
MQQEKRERLESAGWRVGTVQEFLNLSDDEVVLVERKLSVHNALKAVETRGASRGPN